MYRRRAEPRLINESTDRAARLGGYNCRLSRIGRETTCARRSRGDREGRKGEIGVPSPISGTRANVIKGRQVGVAV